MKRKHPDDDPDIPDWDEREGWKELRELDQRLEERPVSTSRLQRGWEEWD